jgi:prepilin-type N-terminal cleavage/methylation domain-containing protein
MSDQPIQSQKMAKHWMCPGDSEGGFTLIEILVAMALVAIFLGGLMSMFVGFSKAYTTENVKADVQQVVRGGVEHMIPHARYAGFDPGGAVDPLDPDTHPAYDCHIPGENCSVNSDGIMVANPPGNSQATRPGIRDATATSIRFTADLNMDGYIDDSEDIGTAPRNGERITYRYNSVSRQVERILYEDTGAPQGPYPIVNNVVEFELKYWDNNDGELGSSPPPEQIEAVSIRMTVEEPAGRDGMIRRTYQNKVRCRNLIALFNTGLFN